MGIIRPKMDANVRTYVECHKYCYSCSDYGNQYCLKCNPNTYEVQSNSISENVQCVEDCTAELESYYLDTESEKCKCNKFI